MPPAAFTKNENIRLRQLYSYNILDTENEEKYDSLTELARIIAGTKWAFISLVDFDRQWFKSSCGLDVKQTDRESSFCAHAILKPEEALVIEDATQDVRVMDSSLVLGEPFIKFYIGIPLVDSDGFALGTLCVIDNVTHKSDDKIIQQLKSLALIVMELIENQKKISKYELTMDGLDGKVWNLDFVLDACSMNGTLDRLTEAHKNREQFLLRDIEKNIHPDDKDCVFKLFNDAFSGISPRFSVSYRQLVSGSWRWLSLSGKCIYNSQGKPILMGGSVIDITEQKILSDQLEQAHEELCQSYDNMKDYTHRLANDLLNPVNAINSFTRALRKDYGVNLDTVALDYIDSALGICTNIEEIIRSSLTLSQIDSRKYVSEEISLTELVNCIVDSHNQKIKLKKIEFFSDNLPDIDYPFDLIEMIFENLISNAINFSDDCKRPTLNILYKDLDTHHQFTFQDNGLGIDKKYHSKIFEPYKRNKINANSRGPGFGLPIVAKIVSYLSGEINFKSEVSFGSSFIIKLPKKQQFSLRSQIRKTA